MDSKLVITIIISLLSISFAASSDSLCLVSIVKENQLVKILTPAIMDSLTSQGDDNNFTAFRIQNGTIQWKVEGAEKLTIVVKKKFWLDSVNKELKSVYGNHRWQPRIIIKSDHCNRDRIQILALIDLCENYIETWPIFISNSAMNIEQPIQK